MFSCGKTNQEIRRDKMIDQMISMEKLEKEQDEKAQDAADNVFNLFDDMDFNAGMEVVKELEDVYEDVDMPIFNNDTSEIDLGFDDEEFDPESML